MRKTTCLMKESIADDMDNFIRMNTGIGSMSGAINYILEQYFSKPKEDTFLLDRIDKLEELIRGDLQKANNANYQTLERVYKLHLAFNHISAVGGELGLPEGLSKKMMEIYHDEDTQALINKRINAIKEL